MSLSLVVLTKDGGERLERLMRWALQKPYFDAINLFIDDSTTEDVEGCSWASSTLL